MWVKAPLPSGGGSQNGLEERKRHAREPGCRGARLNGHAACGHVFQTEQPASRDFTANLDLAESHLIDIAGLGQSPRWQE